MSISKKALLICLFSTFSLFSVSAQQLKIDQNFYGIDEGLASREVLCGLQDKRGFIWFGTRNGLNKYDGKTFKTISTLDGLKRNRVVGLGEDAEGNIWISYGHIEGSIATDGLTDIYNPYTGEIKSLKEKYPKLPFDTNQIHKIIHGNHQSVYILVYPNIIYQHSKDLNFEIIERLPVSVNNLNYYPKIPLYTSGNLKEKRINNSHSNNKYFENNRIDYQLSYFNESGLQEFISIDDNSLSPQIIVRISQLNGEMSKHTIKCDSNTYSLLKNIDSPTLVYRDPLSSAVLIQSPNSLYLFKNYQCIPIIFESELNKLSLLNLYLFSDRQNNYWICSSRGVYKISISKNKFNVHFQKDVFPVENVVGNQIRSIYADTSGNIWTGGIFGLASFNKKSNSYNTLLQNKKQVHFIQHARDKLYLFGNIIIRFNLSDSKISEYPIPENISKNTENLSKTHLFWSSLQVGSNEFLLGNQFGIIYKWEENTNNLIGLNYPVDSILSRGPIYKIIYSPKDTSFWAAGSKGLYRISSDFRITDHFSSSQNNDPTHKLPIDDFRDIYEDSEGIFWLTTNGSGLFKWNRNTNKYHIYTVHDGLPSNILYCILPDDLGNLWISTDNGLVKFNIKSELMNVYSTRDGLSHLEFNRTASFKDKAGRMYFGSIDGLTSFNPRDFQEDTIAQDIPLQITGFHQFLKTENRLVDQTQKLISNNKIIINPGDKFFRLDFALLDYKYPSGKFKYKIDNLENKWQYIDQASIRISGLPYGDYVLKIAGQSHTGAWSLSELTIPIHVPRPYYSRWWAFIIYVLLLAMIIYILDKIRIKRLLEKAEAIRLFELDQIKAKYYTNITHEFRTPLTVILGLTKLIIAKESNEEDDADQEKYLSEYISNVKVKGNIILRNAESLLNLINEMLELSKLDDGKLIINWQHGNVIIFIKYLYESFDSLAESKNINIAFKSTEESIEMDYDDEKMQHIISNLLFNAIKFTPEKGSIQIQINRLESHKEKNQDYIQIKIINTGSYIPEDQIKSIFNRYYQVDTSRNSKQSTGIGLALTKELVDLLGGYITVSSDPLTTTEFCVALPVKNNYENTVVYDRPMIATNWLESSSIKQAPDTLPIILIIEDHADVAFYIKECLGEGYKSYWVKDGQEGIKKALDLIPDVIVSDVMMPLKDGFEVTEYLKNDFRTSHIPVILLTARADVNSKITGLKTGADAYLSKPFDRRELITWIEQLIIGREKLRLKYSGKQVYALTKEIDPHKPKHIEDEFILRLNEIIDKNLSDSSKTIPEICQSLQMSQSQLYRKIKALTNASITSYITNYKIQYAINLLRISNKNISEIAFSSGFSDPLYFSKVFSKETGKSPIEYRKALNTN